MRESGSLQREEVIPFLENSLKVGYLTVREEGRCILGMRCRWWHYGKCRKGEKEAPDNV